jgi:hypothetical protein
MRAVGRNERAAEIRVPVHLGRDLAEPSTHLHREAVAVIGAVQPDMGKVAVTLIDDRRHR